jgi:hypothetical protein
MNKYNIYSLLLLFIKLEKTIRHITVNIVFKPLKILELVKTERFQSS